MAEYGTVENTPAKIQRFSSLSARPTALGFGIGVAIVGTDLYVSDGTTWYAASVANAVEAATNGLIGGAGNSTTKHALGATAGNGYEYYLNATHTTGDMRGQYLRLYFSGAGGSGEASRIFSTINNVSVATGGTVNGAHISLSATGAGAAVSGAGNALRATFGAGADTDVGGTCSTIQVDTDFDATATIPTNFAFLRFTNSGTGVAANLMRIPNASNGTIFAEHTTQTMTHSIKIVSEAGTAYYIMCTDAATNRS
jgi:hypothetical protein